MDCYFKKELRLINKINQLTLINEILYSHLLVLQHEIRAVSESTKNFFSHDKLLKITLRT